VFVEFPAVRHILPAAAPIALLAMRYGLRPQETASRWVRGAIGAALGAGLAVQAVVAFWAAVGDYQYADTYRQFVREAAASLKPPSGNKIWFAGHWGWQHYASAAGFREISRTGPAPKPGDLVLVPDTVHKGAAIDPAVGQRFEQIAEKRYPARSGVVTMDWARAGFYSSGGLPPYYFGKGLTYEVFRTFRVKQ